MGFRPEAIKLKGSEENAYSLECMVELTELLGDNTNVYADLNGARVILKVDPHFTPEEDAPWAFEIPHKSVYWFDKETELVIK